MTKIKICDFLIFFVIFIFVIVIFLIFNFVILYLCKLIIYLVYITPTRPNMFVIHYQYYFNTVYVLFYFLNLLYVIFILSN